MHERKAQNNLTAILETFAKLNPIATEKVEGPFIYIHQVLGLIIDTEAMQVKNTRRQTVRAETISL